MTFMQYPTILFLLTLLLSFFLYYSFRSRRSSLPTNWPIVGMTLSMFWNFQCFHDYTTSLLKQNGGTFMYKGPWFSNVDLLFTSDPDNFNYISSTNFHNYPKGPGFREIFEIAGDGIFNCDFELWELHRKIIMSLFEEDGFLKLLEKNIWNDMVKKLMPVLEFMSKQGSEFDLENVFQRLTFDGIMNILLDEDPKTLAVELPHNKLEVVIAKCEETVLIRHLLPTCCWKFLKRLNIGNEKYLTDASKLGDEIFYKFIYEKQEKGRKANDVKKEQEEDQSLLTKIMREYKLDQTGSFGNCDKVIKDTLVNLLVAGRDTTSSTLTFLFYLLAKNPSAESKILEEIHDQLGIKEGEKWKPFGTKELKNLAYLHGALCEALRLFPPVAINHKVPHEADTLPSGHRVNPGTKILLHSYAMGRMETIWGQDCLEFKPERWFSKQGGVKHIPSYKFTAFHAGPRTCLGKKISLIQMKFVAATIVYNYKVELMKGGHPITPKASVVLQLKHGLIVKVTKRNEVKR